MKNLKKLFLNHCNNKKLEVNFNQTKVIEELIKFYKENFNRSFFRDFFLNKNIKKGFYLIGDVGVGKTMLLDFFYNNLDLKKKRLHFNEFMINFHNFVHNNKKKDSIELYVKELKKKYQVLYFDEFQVTNIVDAMILGKLFKLMFTEDLKIIITSNTKIQSLYKDGLQREQFIPFIEIMKHMCNESELIIKQDYRKSKSNLLDRFFYPLNDASNFKINQLFRKLTKEKKHEIKKLNIKGREFIIKKYFEKIARFDFNDLCDRNIGSEDYLEIVKFCTLIVIENIPNFNEENISKQQRFITLIDIFYENRILLIISSASNLESFGSAKSLRKPFKRTLSRLHELTSLKLELI
jgi:cell division protein ZapE